MAARFTRPAPNPAITSSLPVPAHVSTTIAKAMARAAEAQTQFAAQHAADVQRLLLTSGIALGVMAVASVALGWWAAGRVLRPLRVMTERARWISEDNLDARLANAFEAQRRFIASASHELRTPLTRARTLLEVAMADPDASVESMKAAGGRVLAAGEQQERLIAALLVLARSQRGLEHRDRLDLADLTGNVIEQVMADAGTRIDVILRPAPTAGDPQLARQLLTNLIDNAVRHNVPDGWVTVRTGSEDGRATVLVANSGPVIPPDEVGPLFEPFRRRNGERMSQPRGLGLGLSIVAAVATAHGAELHAKPLPAGGLEIQVDFPAPAKQLSARQLSARQSNAG